MTDTAHPYPVRDPAPGPAVVLDLPRLWVDVLAEMEWRGMTTVKELADLTGLDRNTLGRIRKHASSHYCRHGGIVERRDGQWRHVPDQNDDTDTPCDDPAPNIGQIVVGQRGGVNVNAFLTLHTFVGRRVGTYGRVVRFVTNLTDLDDED